MPENRVDPEVEASIPGAAAAKAPKPEKNREIKDRTGAVVGGYKVSGWEKQPEPAKKKPEAKKPLLSVEERLELIEAELLASSMSFNKRYTQACAANAPVPEKKKAA